jgi:cardiolipin synthase
LAPSGPKHGAKVVSVRTEGYPDRVTQAALGSWFLAEKTAWLLDSSAAMTTTPLSRPANSRSSGASGASHPRDGAPVQGTGQASPLPAKQSTTTAKQRADTFSDGGGPTALPLRSTSPGASSTSPLSLRLGGVPGVVRFGGAALEGTLDAQTASKARPDNKVDVLYDGVASFAERTRLIAGAQSSIHLQTFIFTDDATGRALADQLIAKAKEGVEVRVIIDGLGSNRSEDAFFDEMRAAGVDVRAHDTGLDLLAVNNRWHEKHLIVDGRVAVTGGMNIADEYALGGSGRQLVSRDQGSSEPWRDVDVRIEGAAVHDEQRAFLRNWQALGGDVTTPMAAYFPKPIVAAGGAAVRVVQQHPTGNPPEDHILKLYLHAIAAATKSITIENAYFVPPQALRDALIDAAQRGVHVRVLTNSKESSDMGFVVDAARYYYDELLAAGVEIHEKRGGTLHSKTASFDGQYAIIGSYNLNGRSAGLDTEAVVAIRDDAAAASLDARFNEGVKGAVAVTHADVAKDDFVDDVKQWMFSLLSWTI